MDKINKDYLDSFADKYYLSNDVYDIDVENTMQDESIAQIINKRVILKKSSKWELV